MVEHLLIHLNCKTTLFLAYIDSICKIYSLTNPSSQIHIHKGMEEAGKCFNSYDSQLISNYMNEASLDQDSLISCDCIHPRLFCCTFELNCLDMNKLNTIQGNISWKMLCITESDPATRDIPEGLNIQLFMVKRSAQHILDLVD